eukprot:2609398-Amphidinium_carterae.1
MAEALQSLAFEEALCAALRLQTCAVVNMSLVPFAVMSTATATTTSGVATGFDEGVDSGSVSVVTIIVIAVCTAGIIVALPAFFWVWKKRPKDGKAAPATGDKATPCSPAHTEATG